MQPCPWSANKLKRLGKHILEGSEPAPGLPDYADVMMWYNDLAAEVQQKIEVLDWSALLQDRRPEITSRPKTIDTLRQKLIRDPSTPLPNIQDIAGVRFEAEMTLDEQDAVVTAIAGMFDHPLATAVRDMRLSPHSGYRGVHVWLRLEGRVEVQIRTHLQGQWANVYESAADRYGRDIRYGQMPTSPNAKEVVRQLQELSTNDIAKMEARANEIDGMVRQAEELERELQTTGTQKMLTKDRARLVQSHARLRNRQERIKRSEVQFQDGLRRVKQALTELDPGEGV